MTTRVGIPQITSKFGEIVPPFRRHGKHDLREMLEGWGADFRDYAGGFLSLP